MNKPVGPCLHCDKRVSNCHSTCIAYKDFCQANFAYKKMIIEAKSDERNINESIRYRRMRMKNSKKTN